ncbi:hypothetical protein M408DRAFT_144227 [Serendipita vermifera MAFF 305830]|uniref:Uncharacterized protein n=1 Tax=Serendipita vermifera MAFF 305830 TaxID=933852 RepID=A0A0C3B7V3_SERVB|nr:hypothetical protein M408DRAFT_144227 [Serendipita vermifera MAFF 305830]
MRFLPLVLLTLFNVATASHDTCPTPIAIACPTGCAKPQPTSTEIVTTFVTSTYTRPCPTRTAIPLSEVQRRDLASTACTKTLRCEFCTKFTQTTTSTVTIPTTVTRVVPCPLR